MKKVSLTIALMTITISIISMISISAWAVPGLINYQGKLTDIDDNPLEGGGYIMTFRIYTEQNGGTHLWYEIQTVAVSEGVYNVQLGKNTPLPGDLFDHKELYLEISIFNHSENQDEILSPRQHLTSTPYAMKAAKAADADTLAGQPSAYYAVATHIHSFSDLEGIISDSQVPDNITINKAKGMRASPSTPTPESVGEVYFDINDNMAYIWDGSQWNKYEGSQGPQGPTGPSGVSSFQFIQCFNTGPSTAVKPYYDCTCPSGKKVVSGGGYTGAGVFLRESRPASLYTWRIACDRGSPVQPGPCHGMHIICAN